LILWPQYIYYRHSLEMHINWKLICLFSQSYRASWYYQIFYSIQLNAQLGYSTLKFTLKYSYMFRLTNHHQGAYCRALLKLWLLKQSVDNTLLWIQFGRMAAYYPFLIGVCTVHGAECTVHCTHINQDWIICSHTTELNS